ncbi:MAG: sulfurtransferase TusA family protein [Candidatus Aquicultorales bacterium]
MRHELDLRGVVCPINFVKTKLKLDELSAGEQLVLLLDEGEPVENVPRSAREEGHQVLSLEREDEHYRVVIRKG